MQPLFTIISTLLIGGTMGTWSLMVFFSALNEVDWNLLKLYNQYLIATNQKVLDFPASGQYLFASTFTTELLVSLLFLIFFLVFFRYLKKEEKQPL